MPNIHWITPSEDYLGPEPDLSDTEWEAIYNSQVWSKSTDGASNLKTTYYFTIYASIATIDGVKITMCGGGDPGSNWPTSFALGHYSDEEVRDDYETFVDTGPEEETTDEERATIIRLLKSLTTETHQ